MPIASTSDSGPSTKAIPVLIVGAGPVGLSLACQLSRQGIACRIIERDSGPTEQSRALAIWGRTLEVFDDDDDMETVGQVLERSRRLHGLNLFAEGRRLLRFELDQAVEDTPYPLLVTLPQGETQRILVDRLRNLGVEVEWETILNDLRATASGVTANITGPSGHEQTIQADWLVGCDGSRSLVRHKLGINFEGSEYPETFLLADLKIDWTLPEDEAHAFLVNEGGAMGAFPLPEPGHWRLVDATGAVATDDPALILARFRDLLRGQGHAEAKLGDPFWTSAFRIQRRLARVYRLGRCLLAGDSAHIHSPAGGQGMNIGIQDAHNLAWKLALVVSGESPESLLDSYEAERRPVAQSILRRTDLMTRMIILRRPVARSIRNGLVQFLGKFGYIRRRAARGLSELDIGYPWSPIVAEDWTPFQQAISPTGGQPNFLARLDFHRGPSPGERVPNVVIDPEGPRPRRLSEAIRSPGHKLLIFEGRERSPEATRSIETLGELIRNHFAGRVAPWLVERPEAATSGPLRWEGPRLSDPSEHLHHRFGAKAPCLYLIRPDGHIGYRAQLPDSGKLAAYLGRIFLKKKT